VLTAIKLLHTVIWAFLAATNFDIYLPNWLASHNKTIFGTSFVVNELIVVRCWLKRARLSSANDGGNL